MSKKPGDAGREACGTQRATREDRAVRRLVRNLDTFGIAEEDHRMLACDIAAAKHGKADIARLAGAGLALADHVGHLVSAHRGRGRRLAKRQRGAGRRVDLVVVMGFEDLDVPAIDKLRRHLLDEPCRSVTPTEVLAQ